MTQTYPFAVSCDEFKDKRVLVTGGTKGIGESIVRRFALSGAAVATTARSPLPPGQNPSLFVQTDIGTVEGVQKVVDRIQQEWTGVDILVNSVGGSDAPNGGFQALTDGDWQRALNVNLLAAVRLNRAFIPGMIERKSGVVLHITSIQHRLSLYDATLAYVAAKGALSTYNKGLANEVGPRGVRVNMISPGFIETLGAHGMIMQLAQSGGISEKAARQQIMNMIGGIPIGRLGEPEEVAEVAAFVASDRAASIHGADYIIPSENLVGVTLDMLAAAMTRSKESVCLTPRTTLFDRVRTYIDKRLDELDLAPASIAAAHHISVRYLHFIFNERGLTVGGWIRMRRLDQCRAALVDRRHDKSITEIALNWGFSDAAHFSRSFKASFGTTPTEYRRRVFRRMA